MKPMRAATHAAALAATVAATLAALLAGCASGPRPADWAIEAHDALQRAVQASLSGVPRVADAEMAEARRALASTGRPDLLARAELLRCAADVAALDFSPCRPFESLRADAGAAEIAYARHLAGGEPAADPKLLPAAQQALLAPPDGSPRDAERLKAVADPFSRLLGAALWLRDGRATDAVIAQAVDTASAQGWRRPLVAWLQAQRLRAEQAGDREAAQRIARRIALVLGGAPLQGPASGSPAAQPTP